ncbi:alpha/beta fold hydrolase [Paenisporosarcina cavernae]|uniref:Alpha/beta fold hydrolase n=1 Tax=Paenisporosarcina cavernae TaxID=2320858 RepID=A0A385YTZ4_9BACL|nr:alpha/beta fold hydrolase [Paenisporosarcina cavernae]AYC30329.1 alpha/beta fold hydrolase [Paenisporosarcina cavernae]
MKKFEHNGIQLAYEEFGQGEPLLLLHGLTGNRHMFDEEVEVFQKYFRTIVLDARGHGDSDRPTAYDLKDHIYDVLALLEHLGISETNLLGVSMGSYIAQGIAIVAPEKIKRLILVATKSEGKTSSMQALFQKHEDELEGLDFNRKLLKVSPYMFHDLTAVGKWSREAAKKAKPMSAEEIAAANHALRGFDFRDDLNRIQAITLVISGDHDGLNPPEAGRATAQGIPNATFIEFNQSGHAPNVEQHMLYLDFVLEFLDAK